jgi:hypothetical protein
MKTAVAALYSRLERHHVYPQEKTFENFFSSIKIEIDNFTLAIRPEVHQVVTHGSHVAGLPRWNDLWSGFINGTPGELGMRYHLQRIMSLPDSRRGEGLAWIQGRVVDFATSLLGLYGLDSSRPGGGDKWLLKDPSNPDRGLDNWENRVNDPSWLTKDVLDGLAAEAAKKK